MLLVHIKRILRSGFFNFFRNSFVSLSSILVMSVTLFVIGSIIFMGAILNSTLDTLKDKVDIRVTFITEATEPDIMELKKTIEAIPEVEYVAYSSKEETLQKFVERHENDQLILQALDELGENPLGAALNIKAREPSQYESVANFLQNNDFPSSAGTSLIDKINYFQNKTAINKLADIINSSEKLGFIVTLILFLITVCRSQNQNHEAKLSFLL